jgi:hypothetical protein
MTCEPAGGKDRRRYPVIHDQYRAERARRTLRGIDEQIAKAEKVVAGTRRSLGGRSHVSDLERSIRTLPDFLLVTAAQSQSRSVRCR